VVDVVTLAPERQSAPAAASAGHSSLVAWKQRSGTETSLLASIVTDGVAHAPVVLATSDAYLGDPRVAFGGGVYLVCWTAAQTERAVRVAQDGAVLDPAPLILTTGAVNGSASVGRNGSSFLVVPIGFGPVVRVDPAGRVSTVPSPDWSPLDAGIAWNGTRTVVAFGQPVAAPGIPEFVGYDVFITSIAADGAAFSEPRRLMRGRGAAIASNGSQFLVTATDAFQQVGIWLDASGALVGEPFVISPAMLRDTADALVAPAAVVWTGSRFAVASHVWTNGEWLLWISEFVPGSGVAESTRVMASRPDRGATTTAALIHDVETRVIFSDVRDDGGGSSRVLIDRVDDVATYSLRRRATKR
jgi:hypothetical protein